MNKQNVILDFEEFFDKYRDKIAEFIGWHIGDGCISINSRYSEYALTGDIIEELPFYNNVILPEFNLLFIRYLNKKANLKQYSSNKVCGIYIFNRKFVDFLLKKLGLTSGKKLNIKIPDLIKTKSQKIAFLRGLFDTDGSIYFCKSNYKPIKTSLFNIFHYKPKIKLATISKCLIDQVYDLLCELGFYPRMRKPTKQKINENVMYGVVLYRNDDTKKWINEIGFRNIKHSTKVQIWKKFGFCPPYTRLKQRIGMLKWNMDPLTFYPKYAHLPLNHIKETLSK